jgi:16S rRNA U1498 N3-methylase RsmE
MKISPLIGPEGDFSEKEIAMAIDSSYIPVSLGNEIENRDCCTSCLP